MRNYRDPFIRQTRKTKKKVTQKGLIPYWHTQYPSVVEFPIYLQRFFLPFEYFTNRTNRQFISYTCIYLRLSTFVKHYNQNILALYAVPREIALWNLFLSFCLCLSLACERAFCARYLSVYKSVDSNKNEFGSHAIRLCYVFLMPFFLSVFPFRSFSCCCCSSAGGGGVVHFEFWLVQPFSFVTQMLLLCILCPQCSRNSLDSVYYLA